MDQFSFASQLASWGGLELNCWSPSREFRARLFPTNNPAMFDNILFTICVIFSASFWIGVIYIAWNFFTR